MINEEIKHAEKYAQRAVSYKENDPELAQAFFNIANSKLNDMSTLHDQIVRIINEYRKQHGEPPKEMMAIYNYVHDEQIDNVKEIRLLLNK
jgi:hypothetical protein